MAQPEDHRETGRRFSGQGSVWATVESFSPLVARQQAPAGKPNMSPKQLEEFIFKETTTIPATTALVTLGGLPACGKTKMLLKLLHKHVHAQLKDLKKVKEVTEANDNFSLYELAAIKDMETNAWPWYPFTKRSGYLSCFVSALEHDEQQEQGKLFAPQDYKQYMFDNEVLDNYFYSLYRLLSSLYNEKSATPIPVNQLAGDDSLFLVNVWDIGLNRAVLHFLTVLAGYLHHNFPILALSLTHDANNLQEPIDTTDKRKFKDLEPILHQYSRASYLLQFSHLGRSVDQEREKVCEIVAIVDPDHKPARKEYPAISMRLQDNISSTAEKLGATALLHDSPWIIDPDDPDDLKALKENVDKLVAKAKKHQSGIPLSWFFLRGAFFKTGQLYIKIEELRECAKKCKIIGENFDDFLHEFSGCGSIIHVPDIPVLCNYVILNPVDFFHKLSELFYPRFNGDLRYGIASLSTLRRMFGGDLQFFYDALTACTFAVEIDSNRIEYADTQRLLPIAEKCLYIPGIRTGELEDSTPCANSLLLVYDKALQPTHITVNAVQFLVENVPNLSLRTCECYTVTKFHYYPPDSDCIVSLQMISHGDKNEIRIENNKEFEAATNFKKEIIRAYYYAIDKYKQRHSKLLRCDPKLEFALACSSNPSQHHYINGCGQLCESCKENETFLKARNLWKKLLEDVKSTR